MKFVEYTEVPKVLLTPNIVAMLTSIHEHKGKSRRIATSLSVLAKTYYSVNCERSVAIQQNVDTAHKKAITPNQV